MEQKQELMSNHVNFFFFFYSFHNKIWKKKKKDKEFHWIFEKLNISTKISYRSNSKYPFVVCRVGKKKKKRYFFHLHIIIYIKSWKVHLMLPNDSSVHMALINEFNTKFWWSTDWVTRPEWNKYWYGKGYVWKHWYP